MFRLLEDPVSPEEEQTPGKSHRQRSGPNKGRTDRESLQETQWRQPLRTICWEASDQHGK